MERGCPRSYSGTPPCADAGHECVVTRCDGFSIRTYFDHRDKASPAADN